MASHDAGVEVVCPACGNTVLQKSMIPTLAAEGAGIRYLCVACARALIVRPTVPGSDEATSDPEASDGDDSEALVGADPGEAGSAPG